MDLVDEQHGAGAGRRAQLTSFADHATQIRHAGRDRGQRDEARASALRRDAGEGRLPGPGRPPQDHRRKLSRVDRLAQHASRGDKVLLADELIEVAGPDPGGERCGGRGLAVVGARLRGEQGRNADRPLRSARMRHEPSMAASGRFDVNFRGPQNT